MSDNEDRNAPKDVTIIENQDVDSRDNRRRNNDQTVADDDEGYRLITKSRENKESMYAKEDDAAFALLSLSKRPREVEDEKTAKKGRTARAKTKKREKERKENLIKKRKSLDEVKNNCNYPPKI